jgi:hypothetical protein
MASTTDFRAAGSASNGVMSLKMIPGFGKSGTSRNKDWIVFSTVMTQNT